MLEYATVYIVSEEPYSSFLEIVGNHLKPEGKLIIAIENRMGMKYWAGCREDHVGYFYEGIEGYANTDGAKTFSKIELEKLFKRAGFNKYNFYYPYPDYKFPSTIYSDEYLPKIGQLNRNTCNLDADRMLLFNESLVFDKLIEDEIFPMFSNSFLVEVQRG